MKEQKTEKLAELLMQADDGILEEAEKIDSAKAFQEIANVNNAKQPKQTKKKSRKWKLLIPAAAVLAAVILVFAVLPAFRTEENTDPKTENLPWMKTSAFDSAPIHSFSEFHYRAAMRILHESNGRNTLCFPGIPARTLHSQAFHPAVLADGKYGISDYIPKVDPEKYVEKDTFSEGNEEEKDVYLYEVSPDEVFTIDKVWFFQVEISNPRSFFAGKVGTGVIDVVVTQNNGFEDIITFRNGTYYYSFLANGGSENSLNFSTHKYVEGFNICKNFSQENYSVEVEFDRHEKVCGIVVYSGVGTLGSASLDEKMTFLGNSYAVSCSRSFTVADVGSYAPDIPAVLDPEVPAFTVRELAPVPEDAALDFWITDEVSDAELESFTEIVGWVGARQFYGKGYGPITDENGRPCEPDACVTYLLTAYPDEADGGQFVTRIDITDPDVSVYGINCCASHEQFTEVFEKMGYTVKQLESGSLQAVKQGAVWFRLQKRTEDSAGRLEIGVPVTNRNNILY